jgi:hypothetical protein
LIDSASELLVAVIPQTRWSAFPAMRFGPSSATSVVPLPLRAGSGVEACSGVSRSGVYPLRKAPPDSSPGAPSVPLHAALLTGSPRLPPRGCSTSRCRSLRRCDVRDGVTRLLRSLPSSSSIPPWDFVLLSVRRVPQWRPETSAHGVTSRRLDPWIPRTGLSGLGGGCPPTAYF